MHIVLVETTSVRGFDCVAEMADAGIEVSFVTQNLAAHKAGQDAAQMAPAARLIEVPELGQDIDLHAALQGRLGPNRPDGVICRRESFAREVAGLTEALGLPGETRATALLLGDKRAVRQRLADAGLDTVRWRSAATLDDALQAADALGYPLVVKPANGSFSLGVGVVRDRSELAAAWRDAAQTASGFAGGQPAVLLEACLNGTHISVEMLVQDGEPIVYGVAERDPAPPGVTAEVGGYFPALGPQAERAAALARQIAVALGIRHSALHVEMMSTPEGPALIEVNGRVAGHVVMQQISLALARSVTLDLVALATGRKIDLQDAPAAPLRTVALRALWSAHDGIVVRVRPPLAAPAQVVAQELAVEAGRRVHALRANPDRFGYVLATGANRAEAAAAAAEAAAQLLDRLQIARTEAAQTSAPHAAADPDRLHVVLMDRVGPDSWTTHDGRPLFPPERFRTTVVSSSPEAGLRGARPDLLIRMDIFDDPAVAVAACAVHAASPIHRLAAASERALLPAAALRDRFGAPGVPAEEVNRFIDKAGMKTLARRAGIRCADGQVVRTPDDLYAMLARHPVVVVKPRALSGSQGVAVLHSAGEAAAWLAGAYVPDGFLAEEFIDGEMCHIDALVYDGELLWDVSCYLRDTLAYQRGQPLSSVSAGDAPLRAAAGALLQQVVDGWQVRRAVLHLEAFMTPAGLVFCEVAARPGGAGVVDAFMATRGINLMHAKLLIECGEDPRRHRTAPVAEHSAWTVHYTGAGVLDFFDDSAVSASAYRRRVAATPGGQVVGSKFSGTGLSLHVFACPTRQEALALARRAESQVSFRTSPSR